MKHTLPFVGGSLVRKAVFFIGVLIVLVLVAALSVYAQFPAYKSWLVNGPSLYTLDPMVGIVTTNPSVRLHVRAQSGMEEELLHLENSMGTRYYFKVSNASAGQHFVIGGNAGDNLVVTAG